MVQERQAAGLAAEGTVAGPGEPDGVVEGRRVESGDDAERLVDAVVVDGVAGGAADGLHVLALERPDPLADGKEAARKAPLGQVILPDHRLQDLLREHLQDLFRPVQVVGTVEFGAGRRVGHDKVAETEFAADVLGYLVGEGLGAFHRESAAQGAGGLPHAFLGGLHEDRHLRGFLADEVDEVHAGVEFLGFRPVAAVEDEADIGDDP